MLLNKADESGRIPLFYAAQHDYCDISLYLMIMGSNIFKLDNRKRTLFHYLSYTGRIEVAQILLGYERHL